MTDDKPQPHAARADAIRAAFTSRSDYPYDAIHPAEYAAITGQPPSTDPTPDVRIPADPEELDAMLAAVTPEQAQSMNRLIGRMWRDGP